MANPSLLGIPTEIKTMICLLLHCSVLANLNLTCWELHTFVEQCNFRHVTLRGTVTEMTGRIASWLQLVTREGSIICTKRLESLNIKITEEPGTLTSNENLAEETPWEVAADHLRTPPSDGKVVDLLLRLLRYFISNVPKFRCLALDLSGLSANELKKLRNMFETSFLNDINLKELRLSCKSNRPEETRFFRAFLKKCASGQDCFRAFNLTSDLGFIHDQYLARPLIQHHGQFIKKFHFNSVRNSLAPIRSDLIQGLPNLEWLSIDGRDFSLTFDIDTVLEEIKRQAARLVMFQRLERFAVTMLAPARMNANWDLGNSAYRKLILAYFKDVPQLQLVTFRLMPKNMVEGRKEGTHVVFRRLSANDIKYGWPTICDGYLEEEEREKEKEKARKKG